MALSVMERNPDPRLLDFQEAPKWEYTHGLMLKAFERIWRKNGEDKYLDYIKSYYDQMIYEDGTIERYDPRNFNIDRVNPGRVLFMLYEETGKEKYKTALETLRRQLEWQPRTTEGGFWHKLRYPWQMWLDGAYMGSPFYAEYSQRHNDAAGFDDVAKQLILMDKHLRDDETGLLYHGWDESRLQVWSDEETGRSAEFWGRAIGWYAMAIVDVLDYFPSDHPKRDKLIDIFEELVIALEKYQDKEAGVWYQVVDKGDQEGNYLESSASTMYVYSIAKAVNNGYIDEKYMDIAERGWEGILSEFIEVDENGIVEITNVCAVAGLGGEPPRSGKYEYYINELVRSNDPKAVGPFIMASLEMNK
nr:glycoside hydrolase family 88 protein [Rhodohalobacter sp. 614A]